MIKLYLSHCIRGKDGIAATDEQMAANCQRAIDFANRLRNTVLNPDEEIYVPAEHDLFVAKAYRMGILDESDILKVDCDIIDDCDGVVVYDTGHISRGMEIEIRHAIASGIPVIYLSDEFCVWAFDEWVDCLQVEV